MATVRIVIWEAQGQAWQRCEDHAPDGIREWLDREQLPGWIEKVWTVAAAERSQRCSVCLAETLQVENSKPA